MALVPLLERDQVAPEVQAIYDAGASRYGRVLHTWQAIAHRPDILAAYFPYLKAVAGPGVVQQRIKELTAVEVSLLNHCRYSCSHRVTAARAAGVSDDELRALAEGRYTDFSPREQAALDLAREMTLGPPAATRKEYPAGVPAAVLERASLEFNTAELVDLTMNISLWNALTRFHRVMQFGDDMEPPPAFMDARL